MDFRVLTSYFDGTIFADDYRTDLRAAKARIAALQVRASTGSKEEDQNELLLVQAVFSSICGDFIKAEDYLQQLSTIARSTKDTALIARCMAYETYFQCIRSNPPSLRFRVDIDTGPGVVRGLGLSVLRTRLIVTPSLSPLERFERNVLKTCTFFLTELWLQAFPEHPQYPKLHSVVLFQKDKDYWANIGLLGGDPNFPAIASYCNILTLQYQLAGDADNARITMSSMYEDALEKGDVIAAAHCQLQLGDAISSPPFTSPLALNLVSVVQEVGWSNHLWDSKQHDFLLKRDKEAMQCYQQAHSLFKAGGSTRGTAAVLLRYACLDLVEAILEPTPRDASIGQGLVQSAHNHLSTAKRWFEGDITNSVIVDGYLSICNIMEEDYSAAMETSFNNGELSRLTGNTCTCEFVGLLYLRLAKILAKDKTRVQHAIVLCSCAAICFKALRNPYFELHAISASARLHQQRGDMSTAIRHIDKGRNLIELCTTYFDDLQVQVESLHSSYEGQEQKWVDHDVMMLRSKRITCVADFERLAAAVGMRTRRKTTGFKDMLSAQSDPVTDLLQLFQQHGDLDPSLLAIFQSLTTTSSSIDVWHRKYEDAKEHYRHELVNNADMDAADRHLTDFLQEMEQLSIFSEHLETFRTIALGELGQHERAIDNITRVLPTSFGGARDLLPVPDDSYEKVIGISGGLECQQFHHAIALCFVAKDWKRGMIGIQAMLQQNPTILVDLKNSEDPRMWINMVHLASIWEQNGYLGHAFEWYVNAFNVVENHHQYLADIEDRRDIYSTVHFRTLFMGMARIAFQYSKSSHDLCGPSEPWAMTPAEWKDQMLRFLELGRSRTLLDLILVQQLPDDIFEAWSQFSYDSRCNSSKKPTAETTPRNRTESQPEDREEYLKRMNDELTQELNPQSLSELLSERTTIRESHKKLYQSIPETAIVLHIDASRNGLMILCITSQGIMDVYTAELTHHQLERHIFRFAKLFHGKGLKRESLPSMATCNQHLQAISVEIIEPIAHHLALRDHVIFVPSPSLNRVPLHALLYNNKPLFLSKDVSQVPSLSVLQHLVEKERHVDKKVSVIYKDPQFSAEGALDFSTSAAIQIAHSFHAKPQAATQSLTQSTFVDMYKHSEILLIATHGKIDPQSAWESSLLLHPPFLVRDLVKLQSDASLVIFEACVSGRGEASLGNDVLGFSHAVFASGATAFLGGLWDLSDEASSLLMLFLFDELKSNKTNETLARCWRNAQKRLYELDAAGAAAIFEDLRKRCLRAYKAKLIDEEVSTRLRRTLEIAIEDILRFGVNYSHPFYWAPFVLMGHAGLVLGADSKSERKRQIPKVLKTWQIWRGDLAQVIDTTLSRGEVSLAARMAAHLISDALILATDKICVATGLLEPSLAPGLTRLRWICGCGDQLFSDVAELQPDGIKDLIKLMEASAGVEVKAMPYRQHASSQRHTVTRHLQWFGGKSNISKTAPPRKSQPTSTRSQPVASSQSTNTAATSQNTVVQNNLLHLMACVHDKGPIKILLQDRIQDVATDRALIQFLRNQYRRHRSRLRSLFSLKCVQGIHFVRFHLPLGDSVIIIPHDTACVTGTASTTACACLPPLARVSPPGASEYLCSPVPPKTFPPIPPEYLLAFFTCAKEPHPASKWMVEQSPKRSWGELFGSAEQPAEGWGIYYKEGWNQKVIARVVLVLLVASLVFGAVWTRVTGDLQGGFGVAAWIVGIGGAGLGVLVMLVDGL